MRYLLIALFCLTTFASAGAFAENAAPLGLEVGVADLNTVKKQLGGKTPLQQAGVNEVSGGPILKSNGAGLGIDGIEELSFVFDKTGKLVAVMMQMGKHRLREVTAALRKKYKVQQENIPFVGDASAIYEQGDSLVILNAPHLSFSMTVLYGTRAFLQQTLEKYSQEQEAHQRRQESLL
ncbi:MAG TPA: hypothetical protein PKI22_08850 [Hydrogenophilus thermoluteolus]|uniref:hypothetical protein n=1 Tax=Hydrogenophilus thiooxidans TaxID=2820326 RepID=UPI001C21BD2D|nr:hypothetical protein [Hydrogenophilus thiooxidans]HNQ49507.1 hypothetical protein [Hydrogenophilus thermoluteolus]HNU19267.1 hypothetical protein [Hydrogenophilus thermoluteolus]